jgi:hypothetical protein
MGSPEVGGRKQDRMIFLLIRSHSLTMPAGCEDSASYAKYIQQVNHGFH